MRAVLAVTAERRRAPVEPCRCELCRALLFAAQEAERKVAERRKMLTIVEPGRRDPAA